MKQNHKRLYLLLALFTILALVGGACQLFAQQPQKPVVPDVKATTAQAEAVANAVQTKLAQMPTATTQGQPTQLAEKAVEAVPVFATFKESQVSQQAAVQPYTVQPDLSNVVNPFLLSKPQLEHLTKDGFVVSPGSEKEFFTVYEKARYANVPIFVTSDSLLHSYHLLFDKVLRTAETEHFIPLLADMNKPLLAQADAQYQQLKGGAWEDAALRSVAFIAVGTKLLDANAPVPAYAADLANQELALINTAAGMHASPIFPGLEFGEDYTQYIPRGHYTRSDALKAYFKSMMWYGRMTFRLKTKAPEVGRAETRIGLLLIQAIQDAQVNGKPAVDAWADLYSPTVFFVGRSDDLTVLQYIPVKEQIFGKGAPVTQLADDSKLDAFIAAADQLPPPRILGIVILDTDNETQQTKGLRMMGQRFVPDAYIFRQLIYRNVGTRDNRRGLPMGLDLFAAMGSERAMQILDSAGQTKYENYSTQMQKASSWLSGLGVSEWTETLYNAWIYTFYPLIGTPGEGYPAFMRTQAWQDKQLNASLGSWAELKHDTILYAKQVYAEMGGGPPAPEPVPPKGYVEPVPQFYARLAALTSMTLDGLGQRGLLSDPDRESLNTLLSLATAFQKMSEKELANQPLTEEEYDKIRFYGGDLEHLVMAAADTDTQEQSRLYMDEEPQAAVIADVATDPGDPKGPVVLEEGVGRIAEIHAVVPVVGDDGSTYLQVAKGGVFAYYEFPWPSSDRLTDEKWRGMLDNGQAPALPGWTNSFRVDQGEYADLQQAVSSMQSMVTWDFWMPDNENPDSAAALSAVKPELQTLKDNKQYVGHQLIRSQFASFDLQSADKAVVTAKETWEDKRYNGADFGNAQATPIAHRGPYTITVTYTLERVVDQSIVTWKVNSFRYIDQPPEWQ